MAADVSGATPVGLWRDQELSPASDPSMYTRQAPQALQRALDGLHAAAAAQHALDECVHNNVLFDRHEVEAQLYRLSEFVDPLVARGQCALVSRRLVARYPHHFALVHWRHPRGLATGWHMANLFTQTGEVIDFTMSQMELSQSQWPWVGTKQRWLDVMASLTPLHKATVKTLW